MRAGPSSIVAARLRENSSSRSRSPLISSRSISAWALDSSSGAIAIARSASTIADCASPIACADIAARACSAARSLPSGSRSARWSSVSYKIEC